MSDTPRPKLGLQRPAAPSGDGPKRGPLRSTGFKRHTGQGPSQGRGSASAARPSAGGPRRDGEGYGGERRDGGRRPRGPRPERDERAPRVARDDDRGPRFERSERSPRRDGEGRWGDRRDDGRPPRDGERGRSFDPNRPRGPRPQRDERAPRFSRDDRGPRFARDDRAPRFERSEFGPRRDDDRRDHRERRPDQRPEWRERRDAEGRWGDRRDDGQPPRDGERARSFDPNRPRGPRPERDERAPRFARDDRAPRFERSEFGPRRDDDRRDHRERRSDQRPEWRERRDGEGRWGDRRDDGHPPRDGERARSFDPNRPRGPRPQRDERAPRFSRDDRGPRFARDDRAPRFERSEFAPRRDDDRRDHRERRDGEGRWGDRRDGGRPPRDGDRARSFDPNRPRGPRPEGDDRGPRFARDDRAPRFERSERGNRRDDGQRDNVPEWRKRSLSTPEPLRDDAQADAGTSTSDATTALAQPRWPDAERLNKRLAAMGYCSRREADEWIAKGWVRVNDVVVETGVIVGPNDRIAIDPRAVDSQARRATFVIHKPVGFVSSQAEDGHANAASLLSARSQWDQDSSGLHFSSGMLRGLAPAGRLDIDSTGLLVLTQDGRVARHIIGEDSEVEKEYLVRVHWVEGGAPVTENVEAVFPAERLAQLRFGLALDGQALLPAEVEWLNPEQLRFVLREGKKRQIRRMCEAVGLKVVGLKRVRIGRLRLGHLPVGQWRFLREDEHI